MDWTFSTIGFVLRWRLVDTEWNRRVSLHWVLRFYSVLWFTKCLHRALRDEIYGFRYVKILQCRSGGTGRRAAFRALSRFWGGGSIPLFGTDADVAEFGIRVRLRCVSRKGWRFESSRPHSRAHSSAGRATRLHRVGQRFESSWAHKLQVLMQLLLIINA